MRIIVGYPVDHESHSSDVLISHALHGETRSTVELWKDIRPDGSCDVGRTLEGDIIWIKQSVGGSVLQQKEVLIPLGEPPVVDVESESETLSTVSGIDWHVHSSWNALRHKLLDRVSFFRNRTFVVMFLAASVGLCILMWAGLPLAQPNTHQTSQQATSDEDMLTGGAEDWLKTHIKGGFVPEIVLVEQTALSDIDTTLVSSAGGALLIDVTYPAPSGTQKKTVLVQKTEQSWRLRHVYELQG